MTLSDHMSKPFLLCWCSDCLVRPTTPGQVALSGGAGRVGGSDGRPRRQSCSMPSRGGSWPTTAIEKMGPSLKAQVLKGQSPPNLGIGQEHVQEP